MKLEPALLPLIALATCASLLRCQTDQLMSWEEYATLREREPYVLRLRSEKGQLLYYGVRHTNDPDDPQIGEIAKLWRDFRPSVAFSEGGVRPAEKTLREAVLRYGEPGALAFLADQDGVAVRSIEPAQADEVAAMLKKFAPERLKIFYFLRYIDSYKGMKSDQPIAEYAVGLFKLLARIPGLEGPPHSAAEVDDYLSKFATGVSSWKDVPDSWFHPLKHDSYTNDISRETSLFRDRAMFKVLVESVNRGERVFAVVGAGHVVMQERALRAVLR